jgi:hypothetical protein
MTHYAFIFSLLLLFSSRLFAQDTEFPKGFIAHVKLHNGMVTTFNRAPDLYAGGIQLIPEVTVVEHLLRIGVIADGFYTNKTIQGAIGPTLSVKLQTFNASFFGSAGNLHLIFNHLWGTSGERLIGGGLVADVLNKFTIGITAQRDYNKNAWWFQNELGFRISRTKKPKEVFNQ